MILVFSNESHLKQIKDQLFKENIDIFLEKLVHQQVVLIIVQYVHWLITSSCFDFTLNDPSCLFRLPMNNIEWMYCQWRHHDGLRLFKICHSCCISIHIREIISYLTHQLAHIFSRHSIWNRFLGGHQWNMGGGASISGRTSWKVGIASLSDCYLPIG